VVFSFGRCRPFLFFLFHFSSGFSFVTAMRNPTRIPVRTFTRRPCRWSTRKSFPDNDLRAFGRQVEPPESHAITDNNTAIIRLRTIRKGVRSFPFAVFSVLLNLPHVVLSFAFALVSVFQFSFFFSYSMPLLRILSTYLFELSRLTVVALPILQADNRNTVATF